MSNKNCFGKTTVGQKVLMSVTGLMLFGFLTSHLAGNMLLFDCIGGQKAFNDYAHALTSNPLIYVAEAGLLGIFLVHVILAIKVSLAGKAARDSQYKVRTNQGKSSIFSRSMIQTGSVVFIFIVLHLWTFKFGTEYAEQTKAEKAVTSIVQDVKKVTADITGKEVAVATTTELKKGEVRDLYKTVTEEFKKTWYACLYIFAMVVMGFHLAHAFQSAFQTLGVRHPKYTPHIQKASIALALFYSIGFMVFPIYFGFIHNPAEGK